MIWGDHDQTSLVGCERSGGVLVSNHSRFRRRACKYKYAGSQSYGYARFLGLLGASSMGLSPGTPEHLDTAWAVFFWTHLTQYSNNVFKRGFRSDPWMDGYRVASVRVRLSTHSISACCYLRSMAEPISRYGDFSVGQCDGANTSGHLAVRLGGRPGLSRFQISTGVLPANESSGAQRWVSRLCLRLGQSHDHR